MEIRVGLLGAGRIGKVHAQSIGMSHSSRLVAVSDLYPQAAESLAASYGAQARSTQEILAADDIDAVLIATATNTHADLIEAASAAGKAVFCEKPIDLDLQRAKRCKQTIGSAADGVMMGFNRRFDPHFNALKVAYDQGEIGRGELLTLTSYDPAPPPIDYIKVSGGLFRDMSIHDFDIACWLFGETPQRVTATGSTLVDPAIAEAGDIDTAVIILHFSGGRLAVIKNSRRAAYGYDQRIELLGEKGSLQVNNITENQLVKSVDSGIINAKPEYFFLERYMRAYQIEWQAFVDSIKQNSAAPAGIQDGINALAIAEAANRSYKSGHSVALSDIL